MKLITLIYYDLSLMWFNDWNNFGPLNPNIWGNVSDWVMVTVTGVTGYLIWRTFRSQLEVTRIQQLNYRLKALPELNAKVEQSQIIVRVSQNPIKILRTAYIKLNRLEYFNLYHHYGDSDKGAEISINTTFQIPFKGEGKKKREELHDDIIFFFLDKQDNLYRQVLIHNPNYLYARPQTAVFIMNLKDATKFEETVDAMINAQDLINNRYL